jgi:oxygen-independent coproporphyrinogen-3 oxidase
MREIGIYVHIPFCIKKCKYCDFISFENLFEISEKYVESLNKTIENYEQIVLEIINKNEDKKKNINFEEMEVTTIYFGGGTPSSIDEKLICKVLETIRSKFNVKANCEITIEVNPGAVSEEKLICYKNSGFNRISIGLQETHDEILKTIGRIHTYEEFKNTFELVKKVGFDNINVDLMLALPNQTAEDLEESLNSVIKLNPNHISLYSLILEEGTELEKEVNNGKYKLSCDEDERKMYHTAKKILEKAGYNHYEISNFAKEGFESKHNMNCWEQKEYLGFGVASHSYFDGIRFCNINNVYEYIKNIEEDSYLKNIKVEEVQTEEERKKEYMMLGFRKLEGISISKFEQKFGINPLFYFRFEISELEELGLIEVDLDSIKLTALGLDLANQVFERFV